MTIYFFHFELKKDPCFVISNQPQADEKSPWF